MIIMKDLTVNSDLRSLSRRQACIKTREFIQRKIKIIEDKELNKKYTEHIMEKVSYLSCMVHLEHIFALHICHMLSIFNM